jgi:glutamate/tyrosine decarboxylase-like PLP-dependent enzyme
MRHMGREGYVEYARMTLQAARRIQSAVNGIAGLSVVGRPQLPVFSIRSTGAINIYHLGDALSAMGWHLDRQLQPPSLHLTVSYGNVAHVDDFIRDLREAVAKVQDNSFESMGDRTIQRLTYFAARFLPESWVRKVTSKNIAAIPERKEGTGKTAPLYGLVGELSGKGTIDDMLKDLLNAMNKPSI